MVQGGNDMQTIIWWKVLFLVQDLGSCMCATVVIDSHTRIMQSTRSGRIHIILTKHNDTSRFRKVLHSIQLMSMLTIDCVCTLDKLVNCYISFIWIFKIWDNFWRLITFGSFIISDRQLQVFPLLHQRGEVITKFFDGIYKLSEKINMHW